MNNVRVLAVINLRAAHRNKFYKKLNFSKPETEKNKSIAPVNFGVFSANSTY